MKVLKEHPIQIYLRPDQDKALRHLAKEEKVSIAELVRRGVDRLLTEVPVEEDPAMKLIGLGRGRHRDLSENHDLYVIKALRKKRV